jgi:hypothetical protein
VVKLEVMEGGRSSSSRICEQEVAGGTGLSEPSLSTVSMVMDGEGARCGEKEACFGVERIICFGGGVGARARCGGLLVGVSTNTFSNTPSCVVFEALDEVL